MEFDLRKKIDVIATATNDLTTIHAGIERYRIKGDFVHLIGNGGDTVYILNLNHFKTVDFVRSTVI